MKTIDENVLAAYNLGIEKKDKKRRESIMNVVRKTEKEEAI